MIIVFWSGTVNVPVFPLKLYVTSLFATKSFPLLSLTEIDV